MFFTGCLLFVVNGAHLGRSRQGGVAVLVGVAHIAGHVLEIGLAGDHGAVVAAQLQGRQVQVDAGEKPAEQYDSGAEE